MSNLAESIKRIYISQNKTIEWLQERLAKGTITQAEYNEITK